MAVSKRKAITLHFLHSCKTHILTFSVRFELKPQFLYDLFSLRTEIAAWNFHRSCWHGRMTVPTCWKIFCSCRAIKTKNT